MLGIAAHPQFATNHFVYLFYTLSAKPQNDALSEQTAGNRVVRSTYHKPMRLVDPKLITEFPYVAGAHNGPDHNGGRILFGPDGKLYSVIGADQSRRGLEQNELADDGQDGGQQRRGRDFPASTTMAPFPADNPWASSADPAVRRWFAIGVRNSFGLAFDPVTAMLWDTENGEHKFDEINRVPPKFNSGWTAITGPTWHSDNAGIRPDHFVGAQILGAIVPRSDVQLAPQPRPAACLAFLNTDKYGPQHQNDLLVGDINGGWLFYFKLNKTRDGFNLHSKPLEQLVVEGDTPEDVLKNSSEIMFATNTSGITDIQIGPDGLLVSMVSYGNGCIYVLRAAGGAKL